MCDPNVDTTGLTAITGSFPTVESITTVFDTIPLSVGRSPGVPTAVVIVLIADIVFAIHLI